MHRLTRALGFEIRRVGERDRVRQHAPEIALRRYWHRPRSDVPTVLYEDDRAFHALYEEAMAATQMTGNPALRRQRNYVLTRLLATAPLARGEVAEAGCWRGLSAYQTAAHLRDTAAAHRRYHLFDSFAGLSQFAPEDGDGGGHDPEDLREHYACSLAEVQANLAAFDFITYHQGWIPDCFGAAGDCRFAFVHVDVDLYQPIRDSFHFFYPRLVTGGIMLFDDYGYIRLFPGAKRAIDECLRGVGTTSVHFPLPTGQLVVIKSGAEAQ